MRAVLASLILVLANPAQSAEKQVWSFFRFGKEVQFSYGVPDSGSLTIAFRCKAKNIAIISTVLAPNPKKGQSAKITLSNGTATVSYDGKIGHAESEGFYFEAAAETKAIDLLKSGTTLTINISGKSEQVPLKVFGRSLAKFEAGCFR